MFYCRCGNSREGGVGSRPIDTRLSAGSPSGVWPHTFPRFPADLCEGTDSLIRRETVAVGLTAASAARWQPLFGESFYARWPLGDFAGIPVRVRPRVRALLEIPYSTCWLRSQGGRFLLTLPKVRDQDFEADRGQRGQMRTLFWERLKTKHLWAPLPKPPAASGRAGRASELRHGCPTVLSSVPGCPP